MSAIDEYNASAARALVIARSCGPRHVARLRFELAWHAVQRRLSPRKLSALCRLAFWTARARFAHARAEAEPGHSMSIGAPRWATWRVGAWLARVTGMDRRWLARGETPAELRHDLDRLGILVGFTVEGDEDGWTLTFAGNESHTVTVQGSAR